MKVSASYLQILIVLLSTCLSSCGFTPLYSDAKRIAGPARVNIAVPPGEGGYVFRQRMIGALGEPAGEADYDLEIDWRESVRARTVALDRSITRFEAVVSARYVLRRAADGAAVYSGAEEAATSFDSPDAQFATLTSRRAAFERAAEEVAAQLSPQIALAVREDQRDGNAE